MDNIYTICSTSLLYSFLELFLGYSCSDIFNIKISMIRILFIIFLLSIFYLIYQNINFINELPELHNNIDEIYEEIYKNNQNIANNYKKSLENIKDNMHYNINLNDYIGDKNIIIENLDEKLEEIAIQQKEADDIKLLFDNNLKSYYFEDNLLDISNKYNFISNLYNQKIPNVNINFKEFPIKKTFYPEEILENNIVVNDFFINNENFLYSIENDFSKKVENINLHYGDGFIFKTDNWFLKFNKKIFQLNNLYFKNYEIWDKNSYYNYNKNLVTNYITGVVDNLNNNTKGLIGFTSKIPNVDFINYYMFYEEQKNTNFSFLLDNHITNFTAKLKTEFINYLFIIKESNNYHIFFVNTKGVNYALITNNIEVINSTFLFN